MPMQDADKLTLRRNSFQLVRHVEVSVNFVHALVENGVITNEHKERILAKATNSEKVNEVLTILPRRPEKAFNGFCQALEDTDQEEIVTKYLKPPQNDKTNISNRDDDLSDEDREERFKEVLMRNRARFMDMISIDNRLFAHLIDLHVITPSIQKKIMLNSTEDIQVERLLDYLMKRPIEDLENFLVALRKDRQKHVAEFIEREI